MIILRYIDPLLGRDLKKDNQYSYCFAIGGKIYTGFYAMVEVLLDYNKGSGVFYVVRAEMS
jgi:hypothetical protein